MKLGGTSFIHFDEATYSTMGLFSKTQTKFWCAPGKRPLRPSAMNVKKVGNIHLFVAVGPALKNGYTWKFTDKINHEAVIDFLEQVKSDMIDKSQEITLFCDNAGYHVVIEVLRWCESNGFKVERPPPYTPESNNPCERVYAILGGRLKQRIAQMNQEQLEDFSLEDVKDIITDRLGEFTNDTMRRLYECNR